MIDQVMIHGGGLRLGVVYIINGLPGNEFRDFNLFETGSSLSYLRV